MEAFRELVIPIKPIGLINTIGFVHPIGTVSSIGSCVAIGSFNRSAANPACGSNDCVRTGSISVGLDYFGA
jgi:hypothetical protein